MARSRALRACAEEVAEESIDFTRGTPRIRREEGIRRSGRIESDQSKIVATVPCYNEAPFVADIIRQARKHVDQVIVVDDGSQDGTSNAASAAGATLVRHMVNKGYGEAIKTCFQAGRSNGTDIMVTMDGDTQHLPAEIETLVSPILEGEADLGPRLHGPRHNLQGLDGPGQAAPRIRLHLLRQLHRCLPGEHDHGTRPVAARPGVGPRKA